ncbi:hypothetical protein HETIRDRAFT_330584 [Heterobasidion irregulare TC 32-1]|uniref:Uncharacterized protein n=1 Tax=Heterobasidion irregulare (strain TC 32-1) TaxID=747525 RepID=W4JPZ5_HETIT|nr:uncharacterized protein HETIRDRAFT_330584 [Heterobasidion irregulare TC 32-1]ETW75155.1 hypothetical protein HETIRDRAFT_330584 [Heterobasidion irregulare TC 32-1]
MYSEADTTLQGSLQDATQGDVSALSGLFWSGSALDRSPAQCWDPPPHRQMASDLDIHSPRSFHYMDGTQSIFSVGDSGSHYRLDTDIVSHQDIHNTFSHAPGISDHQDTTNAVFSEHSEAPPSRMPSEESTHPGANDIPVRYDTVDPHILPTMPASSTQSGQAGFPIPHQPAQLAITANLDHGGLEDVNVNQGPHVTINDLMAHPETQRKVLLTHNQQSESYLERTFGKENVKLLPFQNPSDPMIKISPHVSDSPVQIVEQKLFIPYDRTRRALRERSRNLLPSPTFLKSDDGSIGVRLGRATQGQGLDPDSNYLSPVGDRQTLQLKIWISDTAKPDFDKQLSVTRFTDLKTLMKSIAKRVHQILSTGPCQVDSPDDYVLIGYTFVSKGAVMPILRRPQTIIV